MVQLKREFVFGAFVTTTLATALSIASLATDYWVMADLKLTSSQETNSVRYGLFNGVLSVKIIGSSTSYEISMTCDYGENACAMLCRDTKESREEELSELIKGNAPTFNCPFYVAKTFNVAPLPSSRAYDAGNSKRSFINAGCYVSTLLFLSISVGFGAISSFLLFWNMVGNPVEQVCSIYFLYYYIAIANMAVILAVVIWGTGFALTIIKDVAINYTLLGEMTHHGNPTLAFSYWINLGSMLLYPVGLGLLLFRKYLIEGETLIEGNIKEGNQVIF